MGKQINRRGLGTSTGALTLGVAAGSTALMSKALGQGIEVGGQAYVAIKVAMWQLTVDGQALFDSVLTLDSVIWDHRWHNRPH